MEAFSYFVEVLLCLSNRFGNSYIIKLVLKLDCMTESNLKFERSIFDVGYVM